MKDNFKIGDVVRVVTNEGKSYDGFVFKVPSAKKLLCMRVLESSKDKVPTAEQGWKRYGLGEDCCRVQPLDECTEINLISRASRQVVKEDFVHSRIYRNTIPGTDKRITYCRSESYGGWSFEEDDSTSLTESYSRAVQNKEEVENDG